MSLAEGSGLRRRFLLLTAPQLRQAGSNDQDDFEVYCSPGGAAAHGASGSPAAVVMDPFDPALQASLLAGLNPPLCQVRT